MTEPQKIQLNKILSKVKYNVDDVVHISVIDHILKNLDESPILIVQRFRDTISGAQYSSLMTTISYVEQNF